MVTDMMDNFNAFAVINPKVFTRFNVEENAPEGFYKLGYVSVNFLVNNE